MIHTALTAMFDIEHPIVLGPMGSVAGAQLAAAVSNAGGLGMIGGGYGAVQWLSKELELIGELTTRPWGVGLITWSVTPEIVEFVLRYKPHAAMLSFGDPRLYARIIRRAGCKVICQVQDMHGAELAAEAKADLIVAQGTEAGGHGGRRATLPLVPAVVDAVAPIPVLAAGGIADGRGLAAALMLGAHGVLLGTRFYATNEALGAPEAKRRIIGARGDNTERTTVFDTVRRLSWPRAYTGRAIRNGFLEQWRGRDEELTARIESESANFFSAVNSSNFDTAMVWAGEAVDLIDRVEPAGQVVRRISTEAQELLSAGMGLRKARGLTSEAELDK